MASVVGHLPVAECDVDSFSGGEYVKFLFKRIDVGESQFFLILGGVVFGEHFVTIFSGEGLVEERVFLQFVDFLDKFIVFEFDTAERQTCNAERHVSFFDAEFVADLDGMVDTLNTFGGVVDEVVAEGQLVVAVEGFHFEVVLESNVDRLVV